MRRPSSTQARASARRRPRQRVSIERVSRDAESDTPSSATFFGFATASRRENTRWRAPARQHEFTVAEEGEVSCGCSSDDNRSWSCQRHGEVVAVGGSRILLGRVGCMCCPSRKFGVLGWSGGSGPRPGSADPPEAAARSQEHDGGFAGDG